MKTPIVVIVSVIMFVWMFINYPFWSIAVLVLFGAWTIYRFILHQGGQNE